MPRIVELADRESLDSLPLSAFDSQDRGGSAGADHGTWFGNARRSGDESGDETASDVDADADDDESAYDDGDGRGYGVEHDGDEDSDDDEDYEDEDEDIPELVEMREPSRSQEGTTNDGSSFWNSFFTPKPNKSSKSAPRTPREAADAAAASCCHFRYLHSLGICQRPLVQSLTGALKSRTLLAGSLVQARQKVTAVESELEAMRHSGRINKKEFEASLDTARMEIRQIERQISENNASIKILNSEFSTLVRQSHDLLSLRLGRRKKSKAFDEDQHGQKRYNDDKKGTSREKIGDRRGHYGKDEDQDRLAEIDMSKRILMSSKSRHTYLLLGDSAFDKTRRHPIFGDADFSDEEVQKLTAKPIWVVMARQRAGGLARRSKPIFRRDRVIIAEYPTQPTCPIVEVEEFPAGRRIILSWECSYSADREVTLYEVYVRTANSPWRVFARCETTYYSADSSIAGNLSFKVRAQNPLGWGVFSYARDIFIPESKNPTPPKVKVARSPAKPNSLDASQQAPAGKPSKTNTDAEKQLKDLSAFWRNRLAKLVADILSYTDYPESDPSSLFVDSEADHSELSLLLHKLVKGEFDEDDSELKLLPPQIKNQISQAVARCFHKRPNKLFPLVSVRDANVVIVTHGLAAARKTFRILSEFDSAIAAGKLPSASSDSSSWSSIVRGEVEGALTRQHDRYNAALKEEANRQARLNLAREERDRREKERLELIERRRLEAERREAVAIRERQERERLEAIELARLDADREIAKAAAETAAKGAESLRKEGTSHTAEARESPAITQDTIASTGQSARPPQSQPIRDETLGTRPPRNATRNAQANFHRPTQRNRNSSGHREVPREANSGGAGKQLTESGIAREHPANSNSSQNQIRVNSDPPKRKIRFGTVVEAYQAENHPSSLSETSMQSVGSVGSRDDINGSKPHCQSTSVEKMISQHENPTHPSNPRTPEDKPERLSPQERHNTAAEATLEPRARFSKVCRYFKSGHCREGSSCRFLHHISSSGTEAIKDSNQSAVESLKIHPSALPATLFHPKTEDASPTSRRNSQSRQKRVVAREEVDAQGKHLPKKTRTSSPQKHLEIPQHAEVYNSPEGGVAPESNRSEEVKLKRAPRNARSSGKGISPRGDSGHLADDGAREQMLSSVMENQPRLRAQQPKSDFALVQNRAHENPSEPAPLSVKGRETKSGGHNKAQDTSLNKSLSDRRSVLALAEMPTDRTDIQTSSKAWADDEGDSVQRGPEKRDFANGTMGRRQTQSNGNRNDRGVRQTPKVGKSDVVNTDPGTLPTTTGKSGTISPESPFEVANSIGDSINQKADKTEHVGKKSLPRVEPRLWATMRYLKIRRTVVDSIRSRGLGCEDIESAPIAELVNMGLQSREAVKLQKLLLAKAMDGKRDLSKPETVESLVPASEDLQPAKMENLANSGAETDQPSVQPSMGMPRPQRSTRINRKGRIPAQTARFAKDADVGSSAVPGVAASAAERSRVPSSVSPEETTGQIRKQSALSDPEPEMQLPSAPAREQTKASHQQQQEKQQNHPQRPKPVRVESISQWLSTIGLSPGVAAAAARAMKGWTAIDLVTLDSSLVQKSPKEGGMGIRSDREAERLRNALDSLRARGMVVCENP